MAEKRYALVTGANRGLGYEVCRQLARDGFNVILTSRDAREGLSAVQKLSGERLPVEYRRLDVQDSGSIAELGADLAAGGHALDVLVNNAAVSLNGFNAEVARTTIAVNFFGALHVTDVLVDQIADGGSIVMVSSGMGELSGLPSRTLRAAFMDEKLTREGLIAVMNRFVDDVAAGRHEAAGWPSSAYRVSKVGLNALTRILSQETGAPPHPGEFRLSRLGAHAHGRIVGAAQRRNRRCVDRLAGGGGPLRHRRLLPRRPPARLVTSLAGGDDPR